MKTNMPKLRFIEFKDDPEWEEKKLGDFVHSISSGKSKGDKDGKYNLYGSRGIIGKTNDLLNIDDFILIARVGANCGSVSYIKNKGGVSDNALIIDAGKENTFLLYNFEKVDLSKLSFGSGQPLITSSQLKLLRISIPLITEQEKIGKFLSTLDKRIELQEKLIEKLEEEKKGYLQKLFPKKGKNIPELRFEDFKNNGEWEEVQLSELFDINNNGVDKKNTIGDKKVNLLNYMDVYRRNIYTSAETTATNQQLLSCDVKKHDLYITPSSETALDILNAFCIDNMIDNYVFSYHICRLRPITNVNSKFAEYILNSDTSRKEAAKLSSGITRFTLSKKVIEDFLVKVPTLREQETISNFIKDVDENINLQFQRLERMKSEKQSNLKSILA